MRTTLLPGLFIALQHNLNRQQKRVRLFETGLSFVPGPNGLQQEPMIAGLICGSRLPESWFTKEESVDFYDLKGDLESILALTKDAQSFTFRAGTRDAAHPGQCANILREGKIIGFIGALHPNLQQRLSINNAVFMFEIQMSALIDANLPAFKSLSKYPEVRRDIAVIVDQTLTADELLAVVNQEAGETLIDLIIFDVYQGKGIESNRKSLALGLTYQHPSRTLNEDEINESVARVVSALKNKFGAILRE
jgi:phenylalanyl-tRNA synthetase beta chain